MALTDPRHSMAAAAAASLALDLYEYAANLGVTIVEDPAAPTCGTWTQSTRRIEIRPGMEPPLKRALLAVLLGHATVDSPGSPHHPHDAALEVTCKTWAARALIPIEALAYAERESPDDDEYAARALGVPEWLIIHRHLTLTPAERFELLGRIHHG